MKKNLLVVLLTTLLPAFCWGQSIQSAPVTSTSVGVYKKFEAGAALNGFPAINNPYNDEEIDVYAEFYSPSGKTYRRNAFWYQPFTRNFDGWDGYPGNTPPNGHDAPEFRIADNPSYLTPINTDLPWRLRFSSSETGVWHYRVFAKYYSSPGASPVTATGNVEQFEIDGSLPANQLVAKVGKNSRFFSDLKEQSLFPIGMNFIPEGTGAVDPATNQLLYNRVPFREILEMIDRFSDNKANFMRIFMDPTSFSMEWNESGLGNYSARQNRAFDLDELFTRAEDKHLYFQVCLDIYDATNTIFPATNYPEGTTSWELNPYKQLVSKPESFYTDKNCIKYFKRRMRYIMARWDYSSSLFSYEIMNEADHAFSDFWAGNNKIDIYNWHRTIINYMRPMSVPSRHLFTTTIATPDLGNHFGNNGPDPLMLNQIPEIDYIQDHYYTHNKEAAYQDNYLARRSAAMSPYKPNFIGEFGYPYGIYAYNYANNNIYNWNDLHDRMWPGIMSGQAGTPLYWGGEAVYKSWFLGGQEVNFLPVYKFLEGEDFANNQELHPMANTCGNLPGPNDDAVCSEPVSNVLSGSELSNDYLSTGINTSNDDHIAVFALRKDDKILGWVHNKDNYWYNLPHGTTDPGKHAQFDNNQPSTVSAVPLTGSEETITLTNLPCDGYFKVEFYSTQPGIDIDQDGIPDNGGIISAFTIPHLMSNCGELTFHIPYLGPLGNGQNPLIMPDYAFKVTKLQDFWSHNYVTTATDQQAGFHLTYPRQFAIAAKNNRIAYTGRDSRLHVLYPTGNYNDNQWGHVVLTDWSNNTQNVGGDICINDNVDRIVYAGLDNRLHVYWWDPGAVTWHHMWLTDWASNSQNVNTEVSMCADASKIVYRGADDLIHEYYWDSNLVTWVHVVISGSDPTQKVAGDLQMSENGQLIVYKGADNRLQAFYWTGTYWQHMWMSSSSEFVTGSIAIASQSYPADRIYYRGNNGKLRLYYWSPATSWISQFVTDINNNTVDVGGYMTASPNGDLIYYVGSDFYVHQLYRYPAYTPYYAHDWIICQQDLESNFQTNGPIAFWNNKIFYPGIDYNVQAYWYDQGCVPRPGSNEKKMVSAPAHIVYQAEHGDYQKMEAPAIAQVVDHEAHISVSPIPFRESINIENASGNYEAALYDVTGRKILSEQASDQKVRLNTATLGTGVYLLEIRQNDQVIWHRQITKY